MRKTTAIGYCRRSTTDMQENSLAIQEEIIRRYAAEHGIDVLRVFSDKASGRQVKGRDSFLELLEWVEEKEFQKILVRDVTRWGRFDDVDESAYWEYHCRTFGKDVVYIEEDFRNDNSLYDALIKSIKRAMASEFSRKLGQLTLAGAKKIASQGFKPGGHPPYGLRRMLVSPERIHLRLLRKGERKLVGKERVIFVPGEKDEIKTVNLIFSLYVENLWSDEKISRHLNDLGIPSPRGRKWSCETVNKILKNETYIGTLAYNRFSQVHGTGRKSRNPESDWVKCEGAFIPIVEKETFLKAQEIRRKRGVLIYGDKELLAMLDDIYRKHGIVSSRLLLENGLPRVDTYDKRFGSLEAALQLCRQALVEEAKEKTLEQLKRHYRVRPSNGSYILEEKIRLGMKVSFPLFRGRFPCWTFQVDQGKDDFTLGLGLGGDNSSQVSKYFLFPTLLMTGETIRIRVEKPRLHEIYECKDLNLF